ncbi:MAG TPA: ABC transporter substrate-binding protein [Trueperaceae bacterium]
MVQGITRNARLALLMVVGLVCGTVAFSQVQIDYWHGFTGPDLPVMEGLVAEFNETHPDIEVTPQAIPWGNLFQQIEPSVAAGRAPDVVAVNEDVITGFIMRGALAQITPEELSSHEIDAERFYESLWNIGTVDGAVYGVPIHSVMLVMYYNKSLFEEAGLDPENPPQDREAFLAAARALTVDSAGRHPGDEGFDHDDLAQWAVGVPTPWMGGTIAYSVAAQNGVTFVGPASEDYAVNFNSEGGKEAVQFLVDLVDEHQVSPANATEQSEIDAFRQGKAAMNFNGVWMLTQYQNQDGLDFGVAPLPNLGTGDYKVWGGASYLVMPMQRRGDPEEREAALTFISWMTQAEQNLKWTAGGSLPTQPAVADHPDYQEHPMTAVRDALPDTYILAGFPFVAQLRAAWDAGFEAALLGDKSVDQALDDAAAEASARIEDGLQSLPPRD